MVELTVSVPRASKLVSPDGASGVLGGLFTRKPSAASGNVAEETGAAKIDPYAVVSFAGQKFQTKTVEKSRDPEWGESFTFKLKEPLDANAQLDVEVFDHHNMLSSRVSLGACLVPLGVLVNDGSSQGTYTLTDKNGRQTGQIEIGCTYKDPNRPPPGKKDADATAADGEAATGDAAGAAAGDSGGKKTAAGGARQEVEGKTRKRLTDLSTKPTDYQVRVHVIEARNLQAASIDPVVKVTVAAQVKHTRVQKTTTSPLYDEHMMFTFFEAPAKLFEELITFQVFNSRRLRRDALIGSFSMDIGLVYEQKDHMFGRTWLMLTDPNTAVMGYLKISVTVLGPGDEAVIPEEKDDEDDDIEHRVLRPTGAELETVDMTVRLFNGEDIPQKDVSLQTGNQVIDKITRQQDKMYCDPYMRLSFAGKLVMSKVIDDTYFPEWNQELHLSVQMPSMCDRIRLQVWDSDTPSAIAKTNFNRLKFADDLIATQYLDLKAVSSTDIDFGFLPTFGPAFINFYGSTREFFLVASDYSKKLDAGVGEGYAFRGRVLMQIDSLPVADVTKIGKPTEVMPPELELIKPLLKRCEYVLRLAFCDVTLLDRDKFRKEITFEVSVGTMGNVDLLDEDASSVHCLTFPALPTSDGIAANFLPWDNKKPCLEMTMQWENVSFRIHALNVMRSICRRLDQSLRVAETLLQEALNLRDTDAITAKKKQAQVVLLQAANVLLQDCSKSAKPLPDGITTRLDVMMQRFREDQKNDTADICRDIIAQLQATTDGITPDEALESLQARLRVLTSAATEAQTCIPDIIVSLMHKSNRLAYVRVPVVDYLWSSDPDECGPFFGQSQTFYLKYTDAPPKKPSDDVLPGMVQMRLWFGVSEKLSEWPKQQGQYVALAETFENQRYVGTWSDKFLANITGDPPAWSDRRGKMPKNKDDFKLPSGWQWRGDWYIDPPLPDIDIFGDQDTVVIEVFENERRQPIKGWCKMLLPTDPPAWSDRANQEERTRESVMLPAGWLWTTDWQIDMNRAVDRDGWEYAFNFQASYHAAPKRVDFVRRRRWFIERTIDPNYKPPIDQPPVASPGKGRMALDHGDGWMYALTFGTEPHSMPRKIDVTRRRRWHRELLVAGSKDGLAFASIPSNWGAAGTFLAYKYTHAFQLRAHLYQARDLPAEDSSGLSDPYVRVSFSSASGRSIIEPQTLTPTWDEVIVLENVMLHGNYEDPAQLLKDLCTRVQIEVYDFDMIGKDDVLGRCSALPQFRSRKSSSPAVLEWFKLMRLGEPCGELLAAFEVIPMEEKDFFPLPERRAVKEPLTSKVHPIVRLPEDIRPEMQLCRVRVLTWGLRELAKVNLLSVTEPHIEFECGGVSKASNVIKSYKEHPNFSLDELFFDVHLPVKAIYAPPLNIRVFDNRKFGRKPLVGSTSLHSLADYQRDLSTLGQTPKAVQDDYYANLARKAAEKRAREAALATVAAMETQTKAPEPFGLATSAGPVPSAVAGPADTADRSTAAAALNAASAAATPTKKPVAPSASVELVPLKPISTTNLDDDLPGVAPASAAATPTSPGLTTIASMPITTITTSAAAARKDSASGTKAAKKEGEDVVLIDMATDLSRSFSKLGKDMLKFGSKAVDMFQKLAGDDPEVDLDKEIVLDWWSKFYASIGHEEAGPKYEGDKIQVLSEPLERVYDLEDQIHSFVVRKGKKEREQKTGMFKGNFAVFVLDAAGRDPTEYDAEGKPILPTPKAAAKSTGAAAVMERMGLRRRRSRREQDKAAAAAASGQDSNRDIIRKIWPGLPDKSSVEVLVRLYLVRGLELTPRDDNGLSDPFVIVTFGKHKPINDKKNYIARNLNPVFGKVFEQECVLPRDAELVIQVYDFDLISANDLIGITTIDLESRWLTSKRATVGMPRTYHSKGLNKWRDIRKPTELLEQWCTRESLGPPVYTTDPSVTLIIPGFNGDEPYVPVEMEAINADEEEDDLVEVGKENAALMALHSTGLVKEYVETRPLYDPAQPDLEQGKLQLWVDMFQKVPGVPYPPPVDISPRKPKGYVLRVIIWNTAECELKDVAITGEKMSDLYVKGFIRGLEKNKQKTDVHYRSLDGEGNFNWRMVFPFKYQPAEELVVVERKPHIFSREVEIVKVPAVLSLTVWDADVFHSDDYIGSLELDLNHFVSPGSRAATATRLTDEDHSKKNHVSLFRKRRARGWYCVTSREKEPDEKDKKGKKGKKSKKAAPDTPADKKKKNKDIEHVSGKIEIELELLTEEEALERPAGQAREDPNQYPKLDPPHRPATSFFWFTSPWKSFKFIIWKHYKWYIICALLLIIFGLLVFLFVYTAPAALMQGLVQKLNSITDQIGDEFTGNTPTPTT